MLVASLFWSPTSLLDTTYIWVLNCIGQWLTADCRRRIFVLPILLCCPVYYIPTVPIAYLGMTKTTMVKGGYIGGLLVLIVAKVLVFQGCPQVFAMQYQDWKASGCTWDLSELYNMCWRCMPRFSTYFLYESEQQLYYSPSLGIRWYLDAQMLPEYYSYFETLFVIQPIVCCWLIYAFISPVDPKAALHIAIAVVSLFKREITIIDVIGSAVLLLQHTDIVRSMRHGTIIAAGILVPLLLSPLMFVLWVEHGTGNANYFFFQGVCLWLFCALGISEFTFAVLKSCPNEKRCKIN